MSFMFNPLPYDDMNAINYLTDNNAIQIDTKPEDLFCELLGEGSQQVIIVDGYIGADFHTFLKSTEKSNVKIIPINDYIKSTNEIETMISDSLPMNYEDDPVLIFGKLYQGEISDFFDTDKIKELKQEIANGTDSYIVYGFGSSSIFRFESDTVIYIDVTPKEAVLRAAEGKYTNVGETRELSFEEMMRRYYFVDVEIIMNQRKKLIQDKCIDYYALGNKPNEFSILKRKDIYRIFKNLSKQPFRCKPVYLEGVWGGEFIRKIRNLPEDIAPKIAWIFEFIPLEASVAIMVDDYYLDIPFCTFLNAEAEHIMGKEVNERFQGYFPIRFNYDDTWHSNGNMSIQVHPDKEFAKENYNEFGAQDEAYYVVNTGHDAKVYCGFKKDGKQFLELCEKAQKEGSEIPYEEYINTVDSYPGRQVMIPSRTIHSSGRNQLVLELGSLTVGAYTYKVYDYNRRDKDGKLRPIHLKNAKRVLDYTRDGEWVDKHIAYEPILIEKTDDYQEYIIGKTNYMYYETHRINLNTHGTYIGRNDGQFTVVTLVDGESAIISSNTNPEFNYHAKYLDVITIPADIDEYKIEAKGYQPVVIHKTILNRDEKE